MSSSVSPHQPLRALARQLSDGSVSARTLVEESLGRITDEVGEGALTFLTVAGQRARAEADAWDSVRRAGGWTPPFAGIPIGVKDLADVAGETTSAGSTVLLDAEPAADDAPAVGRLRAAGFIVVGRTNMTEFAFSGLGLNPHHGTPAAPWDRSTRRIPGGSSSGSAVAVADGMVALALGTDTGGSCRIPAAFCNIVGYKPTARRVPLDGILPLAPSLDSVGPLSNTVDCVALADAVLAGAPLPPERHSAMRYRLGVITNIMLDDLDDMVASRFESALSALSAAGHTIVDVSFPELDELPTINRTGGLAPAEALAWHRPLIERAGDRYDPRVRRRIEGGSEPTATDYIEVLGHRRRLISRFDELAATVDAFIDPTVAILPPTLADFPVHGDPNDPKDRYYSTANRMALRNTSVGNFLDGCAISLPMCRPEDRATTPAVGVMVMAPAGCDESVLQIAADLAEPLTAVG